MKKRKYTHITVEIGGQKIRKSVAYRTTEELVKKRQQIIEDALRTASPTVEDVADMWQEEHFKTIEHYTADGYKAPLKDVLETFGSVPINELSALEFQAFLERMGKLGYARQTINLRKIVMSQIMDYALLHGFVQFNPVKVCQIPKKAKKETVLPPSDDEISKIMAAPDSLWRTFYMFLMFTGLRRGEALALTYGDLDFDRKTVSVSKTLIYKDGHPEIKDTPKTRSGVRLAPFPTVLHRLFPDRGDPKRYLFAIDGSLISKGRFDKGVRKFQKDTGISCGCHQLRHYFATLCHGTIDAKDAQALLGHAHIQTTMDIYTAIDKRAQTEALEKIDERASQVAGAMKNQA